MLIWSLEPRYEPSSTLILIVQNLYIFNDHINMIVFLQINYIFLNIVQCLSYSLALISFLIDPTSSSLFVLTGVFLEVKYFIA